MGEQEQYESQELVSKFLEGVLGETFSKEGFP